MGYVWSTVLRLVALGLLALALASSPCGGGFLTPEHAPSPGPIALASTPTPTTAPSQLAQETATPAIAATPEPTLAQEEEWRRALRASGIGIGPWETDFSKSSVDFDEIMSGGPPRDGIPPLDEPTFNTAEEADAWLDPLEPVVFFENDGDARAYPLQVMTWHEIVNDEVGGLSVCVTFCPLCNSAIVFDRRLAGAVFDFGTSGNLRNSDLIMWDRQTESWWQQLTGEAIVGELTGEILTFLPSTIIAWEDFKANHPQGKVLSRDTGFTRDYGSNPYVGYDRIDNPPFLYRGDLDGRLLPKERVAAVSIGEVDTAYSFTALEKERVVNDEVNGQNLVVFFKPGARSALDDILIEDSKQVGATAVFDRHLEGRELTFSWDGERFADKDTGTTWNLLGQGIDGPLVDRQLKPIVHANHFWFAWAAFKPDTLIYQGAEVAD